MGVSYLLDWYQAITGSLNPVRYWRVVEDNWFLKLTGYDPGIRRYFGNRRDSLHGCFGLDVGGDGDCSETSA